MFKSLIKVQANRIFRSFVQGFQGRKNGAFAIAMFIFIFAYFGVVMAMSYSQMLMPMHEIGIGWMYYVTAGLAFVAMCMFGSVLMAQSAIYDAQDNDLLLSMPIKPWHILISRLTGVYLLNLVYGIVLLVPALIVYIINLGFDFGMLVMLLLGMLFLAAFAAALTAVFGWLIAVLSSVTGQKNLIRIVLSVVLMAGYIYGFTTITANVNVLIENGHEIGEAVRRSVPQIYYFGKAVWDKDIVSLLISAVLCTAPAAVIIAVISQSFVSIIARKKGEKRREYRGETERVKSPVMAIAFKEIRKVLTTPLYLLNSLFGGAIAFILGAAILVMGERFLLDALSLPPDVELPVYMIVMLMGMCGMLSNTAAHSISLEGKYIHSLRAFPLEHKDIFAGKILANIMLGGAMLLPGSVMVSIGLRLNALSTAVMIIVPMCAVTFAAVFGLLINLHFPKLDWINEAAVVKQSMSSFISAMGGPAIGGCLLLLYNFVNISTDIYALLVCAVLLVIAAAMWAYLKGSRAGRMFEEL